MSLWRQIKKHPGRIDLIPTEDASLRSYFHILRKDGVAAMSGGLGVLFAFVAAYFEWVVKNGKAALWVLAALSFFYASYRVWAAERERYSTLISHKVIPHVIKEPNAHLSRWNGMDAVYAIIGLKFENIDSHEIALKAIRLRLCERWNKRVWELPLRGSDPLEVHQTAGVSGLPSKALGKTFASPTKIEGLRIKPKDISAEPYYLISDTMAFPDYYGAPANGTHFLRLTVDAVAQKPYMIDIEVDWTRPGLFIMSSAPAREVDKTVDLTTLANEKKVPPGLIVYRNRLKQTE